ncbi:MAG TPA: CapA family protein [Candidatus Limnocylindrales bacterium]|nr:CapA family protein [Candidatus Limnocylindrales bacterium]
MSRQSQAHRPGTGHTRPPLIGVAGVVLAIAAVVGVAVSGLTRPSGPAGSQTAVGSESGSAAAGSGPLAGSAGASATASLSSAGSPSSIEPSSSPTAPPIVAVPIVPVADYRTTASAIVPADVAAVIHGTSPRWTSLELVGDESQAVLAALGASPPPARLVTAANATTLMTDLAAHRNRLGFLRADEVGPGVRALGWQRVHLFGVHRLKQLDKWPLTAQLPAATDGGYDPAVTWTMFVAGDLGLDRGYANVVTRMGAGPDYPFDGGTARIAGLVCCSPFGWKVPTIVSTGHRGAMRDLISSADLALANMEESAPNHFTFHAHGTVFTGNPALIAGIARAGIDVASAASTHIGDGGRIGILQTIASLTKNHITAFGAGPNLGAARQPAIFEEGGVKIAILGNDGISDRYYGATPTTIGDAPLKAAYFTADIAAARRAGAQVVIVYPHWGIEYTFGPSPLQQRLGRQMIDAGADMVIGNHPHWVQSVEIYKGKPIWYSLGNFTFDQSWSEPTLEGVSLELTFRGARLVQAWMNPHILVRAVQPNLLDIAGDGQRVLGPVFRASGHLLPW